MIRKWLKFNTSFVELLNNSSVSKVTDQKWPSDGLCWHQPRTFSLDKSFSTTTRSTRLLYPGFLHPDELEGSDSDDSDAAVTETPTRTELFEIKGPNGTGFLIEVRAEDLQEVRRELNKLKGDDFHYDKNVIGWFTLKSMLTAEALPNCRREQGRLAKVHGIASGSEEVHKLDNGGNFLFVNSVDRTLRAKRILEKLGYKISGILYRFQPNEKIILDDASRDVCRNFIKAVEKLPKVISITHNV